MSNEAQHLLNHIQYKTGKSLDEIAKEIGYSRPYLNKVKLRGVDGGKIVGVLKSKYTNELRDVPRIPEGNGEIPGYIPAERLIQALEEQNAFLRRNFEISLNSIAEGQQQAGNQIKALSWYSALVANSGDERKAEKAMQEIGNKIASYEGIAGEDDSLKKEDKGHTSGKEK